MSQQLPTYVPDDADASDADTSVDAVFSGLTIDSTVGTHAASVRGLDFSRSFSDVRAISVNGMHFVRTFVPDLALARGPDGPHRDGVVDIARDRVQCHYNFRGNRLVQGLGAVPVGPCNDDICHISDWFLANPSVDALRCPLPVLCSDIAGLYLYGQAGGPVSPNR